MFQSDVLPMAWQAVGYTATPKNGTLVVLGLGPIGAMCTRIARRHGVEQVIGIDPVSERLTRVGRRGGTTLDLSSGSDQVAEAVRAATGGRGADAVIDAVGMETYGSPVGKLAPEAVGLLS